MASDYTGRSVDLSVFSGVASQGMVQVGLTVSQGKVVTGIQKLSQIFTILFLSETGSRLGDSAYGTGFLTALRSGNLRPSNVQVEFAAAAIDVVNYQRTYAPSDAPDDEVLESAELMSINIPSPDRVELTVRLRSEAGDERDVIMPASLAIK